MGVVRAAGSRVDPRWVLYAAAAAAVALRFPGLAFPVGPDEAGFTIVARHWDPRADSLYGDYWVDRPPILIALVKLSDLIGGPLFLRVIAAAGCGALVLLSAATARALVRHTGVADERFVTRTGAWTAVLAAAFTSTAMIDPVMAKGEVLGIPFVVASFWLVLRALEQRRVALHAVATAAGAGSAAVLALGMKQNMVAGLVFGATLIVGARLSGRTTTRGLARLGLAWALGAATPVVATLCWAAVVGVGPGEVWYAVYGFRLDALSVIAAGRTDATLARALLLTGILGATGMAFVLAGVLIHHRRLWALDRTLVSATGLVVLVDLAGLLLGGSFWRPYLFVLVPGLVLCAALLLTVRVHVARRTRTLVVAAAVCSAASSLVWASLFYVGVGPPVEVRSGRAIAAAAEPGDSIMVYGGRADLVLASGLEAPYPYLWSLPMRTRDPDLVRMRSLLSSPQAPTWVVMWAPGWSWDHLAAPIRPVLEERYVVHGQVCNNRYVWLRSGQERPALTPDCS